MSSVRREKKKDVMEDRDGGRERETKRGSNSVSCPSTFKVLLLSFLRVTWHGASMRCLASILGIMRCLASILGTHISLVSCLQTFDCGH